MDVGISLRVITQVLAHAQIPTCLVGELTLNYYNVPRVLHDLELCVPVACLEKAASKLCNTGLFEPHASLESNLYTEYKSGFPRLRTTPWLNSTCYIVLFPDEFWYLDPLSETVISRTEHTADAWYSSQAVDAIGSEQIKHLPFPRLDRLLKGLVRRYLSTQDPMARIAVEQLVDGMNVEPLWLQRHLDTSSADTLSLLRDLIRSKAARMDEFSNNNITCFVANEQEAMDLQHIPGYD